MVPCKSSPLSRQLQKLLFCLLILFAARTAVAQIRTVLVSPVPGDPIASGTALRNALAGISAPSSTNRWLLKIEPGIYDIGATSLQMRSWVDIEGSGIGVTTIRGTVDPSGELNNGTVNGASDTELRLLTVEATGNATGAAAIAMYNESSFPRLYRVKLVVQSGNGAWGIRNVQSAPLLEECEITVSAAGSGFAYGIVFREFVGTGQRSSILRSKISVSQARINYGLYLYNAQTVNQIQDTRIDVVGGQTTYGIYAITEGIWTGQEQLALKDVLLSSAGGSSASYGAFFQGNSWVSMEVFTSRILGHISPITYGIVQGAPAAILLQGSSVTGYTQTIDTAGNTSIASTYLQGGPVSALGWLGCMGVWDENGVFYTNSCPP